MSSADFVTRLRASESPTLWRLAGIGCRLAYRFSPHRSRWTSRLGYVLERMDQAREAKLDAAASQGPAAAEVLRARRAEQAGNLVGAAAAWRRVVERDGDRDPRWGVRFADLLDRTGQWGAAQWLLRDNAGRHPGHALSHRRLGEVSLTLARWGGAFTGTLSGHRRGRIRFDRDRSELAHEARRALERAAELEPAKTTWRVALAEARLADGDPHGAIALYEAGLRDAQQSTGRWVLAVKHRWQFAVESIYHELGQARVEDPLFACAVTPGDPVAEPDQVVGLFRARVTFAGVAITGFVTAGEGTSVEILLDGEPLRPVNLGGEGFFPAFELEVKRATLASFPRHGVLQVRAANGVVLRTEGGADRLHLSVPHGDGRLSRIIAAGATLDKKGTISRSPDETRLRQERYLEIYATVRDFFENELNRPLFLLYGTLLGFHRDGDFIPGDDDFDAGYVSDEADPVAVKEETKGIIVQLIRAGFTVSFNRRGRLFRLQLERQATDGFHLDLRPVWFQRDRVWVHNHCSFPSSRDEFLPVVEGRLRGVRVLAPRDTEAFLRGHYGPGWSVPDPGFMYYPSEIDPAIHDNLAQALITVREYRDLAARIRRDAGDSPSAGRLVSVGSQDLYPLEEFLA